VNTSGGWYFAGMATGVVWGLAPTGLGAAAAAGGTRAGSQLLNRGQNIRIGPGRMPEVPSMGPLPSLPAGPKVPRISIGADRARSLESRPHFDLRSRFTGPAPVGPLLSGAGGGGGSSPNCGD
jgi:hypothetical protein